MANFANLEEKAKELGVKKVDLNELLRSSDIISLHTPLTEETKNIIGKAVIVHQGQDDLHSQPSGAAGARVSCAGVIQ